MVWCEARGVHTHTHTCYSSFYNASSHWEAFIYETVIERPHAVLPATRVFISFAKWNSRACIFLLVYSHTPKRWAAPAARVFPQSYALRSLDRRHAQRPGRPSDALSMMKMTPRSGRAAAAAAAAATATPIRINTHSLPRHARRWKLPSVGRGCKPLQLFV